MVVCVWPNGSGSVHQVGEHRCFAMDGIQIPADISDGVLALQLVCDGCNAVSQLLEELVLGDALLSSDAACSGGGHWRLMLS